MIVRCLIIDDEPLAINVIKNYLQQIEKVALINAFSNAIDGLNFLKENTVDLIFLDISMPLLDGLNFIKSLDTCPLIIITSAHEEFAVESFELDVLDYLVKPISFPRFMKSINKVFKSLNKKSENQFRINEKPYIFIKVGKKKMIKLFLDDILVIESLKDYLKINTSTHRYIIHQTLCSFTEQLRSKNFIRIHRSYTIAIDKVDTVEGNSVEIAGIRYTIGRTYIDEVKNRILNSSSFTSYND